MIRPDLANIPPYVPGKSGAKDSEPPLKLSSNESAFGPLPSVSTAIAAAGDNANRYPDITSTQLREKLAQQLGVGFNQVITGTGSSALCQQLVQITCLPGDEVVFPWRSFEAYPIFAQVVGATPRPIPLLDDGRHDLDSMLAAINDRTRLIFLCSPNNPTGATLTRAEFDDFVSKVPNDIIIALDEAYIEFNRDPEAVVGTDIVGAHDNVVCLRTFSKAYGLAGLRVGYAYGPEKIIDALGRVAIPFSVSAVAQAAAIASLEARDELLARTEPTVAVRDKVADHIGAARSQANFVWIPGDNSAEIAAALAEQNVLVRAFPEGTRITVTDETDAERFLEAWDKAGLQ